MLTQERLKELVHYDEHSGVFIWLERKSGRPVTTRESESKNIMINGRSYRKSRLAWLYCYGTFPIGNLRYIDGNSCNNSIANLEIEKTGDDYVITQDVLKYFLLYSPYTGSFIWRRNHKKGKAWTVAGYINQHGYCCIAICKKLYRASRLAWLYTYGIMPTIIDHIDQDKLNDRIDNLRVVTTSENGRNSGKRKNNKSGCNGVWWSENESKWKVSIFTNKKSVHLGYYGDFTEAVLTRWIADNIYDFSHIHGMNQPSK
jgi:hypothetical protein